MEKRASFGSRLGFILVSAGCAIGIGNVWRFPTLCGESGGGVFVLFYLLFLIGMGIPILTMEQAVGRAGRGSAGAAYRALEPKGSKWHWHGWALPGRVLPADDVLHHRQRLDDGLLLQIHHRRV